MNTETYIPWDEWGRDAIVMETPAFSSAVCVQGVHAVEAEIQMVPGSGACMYLRTFDFSKRGCSSLCDEGGGAVQAAWYDDGRDLFLVGSGNVLKLDLGSLGKCLLLSGESPLPLENKCRLIPW
jgi:hypothetical protein